MAFVFYATADNATTQHDHHDHHEQYTTPEPEPESDTNYYDDHDHRITTGRTISTMHYGK